jgi:hypothetical protein
MLLTFLLQVLPQLDGWVPYGSAEVDGTPASMWQLKEMAGEKVNTYTFYISEVCCICT